MHTFFKSYLSTVDVFAQQLRLKGFMADSKSHSWDTGATPMLENRSIRWLFAAADGGLGMMKPAAWSEV